MDQKGYSIVETLTAMAVFSVLIIPFYQTLVFFQLDNGAVDRMNAVDLAERELESALLRCDFGDEFYEVTRGNRKYIVRKKMVTVRHHVMLQIEVLSVKREKYLAILKSIPYELR